MFFKTFLNRNELMITHKCLSPQQSELLSHRITYLLKTYHVPTDSSNYRDIVMILDSEYFLSPTGTGKYYMVSANSVIMSPPLDLHVQQEIWWGQPIYVPTAFGDENMSPEQMKNSKQNR